jgi:hypothetical protein
MKYLKHYVRFKLLMAVKMVVMFWVLMPCKLAGTCQCFRETYRAKVMMLECGGIYIRSQKGKVEGQSDRSICAKRHGATSQKTAIFTHGLFLPLTAHISQ